MNNKFSELEKYLLDDDYVMVHIYPKHQGVKLPENLRTQATLNLKLSNFFVGKLELQEDKIVAELTFDEKLQVCEIPWEAVYAYTAIGKDTVVFEEKDNQKKVIEKERVRPTLTRIK